MYLFDDLTDLVPAVRSKRHLLSLIYLLIVSPLYLSIEKLQNFFVSCVSITPRIAQNLNIAIKIGNGNM